MARSRSERNPRTARCARFAARGLVIAGLAGVAWLLSASAAHAADDAATQQASLIGPVTNLVTGLGGSGESLLDLGGGTAHGGTSHGAAATHRHATDGDLVTGTVLTVLRPVTDTVLTAPASAAITAVAPTTATLAAIPLSTTIRSTTVNTSSDPNSGTKRSAYAGINTAHRTLTQEPAVQAVPVGVGSGGDVSAAATGAFGAGDDRINFAALRAGDRRDAGHAKHETPVVDRTVAQGTHHVPLLPRPAPVPASPAAGLAAGAPSTGSGLDHVGGAAATPPATLAGAKVLTFRPDAVEDVELRLLAAESPTVSPD